MSASDASRGSQRGLPLLSGPPPPKEEGEGCRKCGKEFNIIFARSRRCNHCGYMYCHNCSDYQALMPRAGPERGYDVMNVCGYCIEYLTITAGGRSHLKSLGIGKLRKYAAAYNINIERAVEKDDIIEALMQARTGNGCLPPANENFYRKHSVPAAETRPGLRNIFRGGSSANANQGTPPPPPPPRDRPPRHTTFARPDLAGDQPPSSSSGTPPYPPPPPPSQSTRPAPQQQQARPPPPPPPHPQYQQAHPSQGGYAPHYGPQYGQYGAPPPPAQPTGGYHQPQPAYNGYPGAAYHQQQQQQGYGQGPGGWYNAGAPPSGYPPPHGAQGASPPPPPPPPRESRPAPPPPPRSTQPSRSPTVPTLDELVGMSKEDIGGLSVGVLKQVLFVNHVSAGQVLEKGELVRKVEVLVEAERVERERMRRVLEREEMERAQREEEARAEREREREERERRERAERVPEEPEVIRIVRLEPADGSEDEGEHGGAASGNAAGASGASRDEPRVEDRASPRPMPAKAASSKGPSPPPASTFVERTGLCVVCQDEEANIAIVDCGHLAMCRGCSELIMNSSRECPLCRTRIVTEQRLLRIFKT